VLGWCLVVGSIDGFEGKQQRDFVIKNLLSVGYICNIRFVSKQCSRKHLSMRTQTTKYLYENTNHKVSM
jgi:hypothetical protein